MKQTLVYKTLQHLIKKIQFFAIFRGRHKSNQTDIMGTNLHSANSVV